MRKAAQPGLYDPGDERPMLHGTRCDACGTTFFPPLGLGCEVCGATPERLIRVALTASGVLHSVATVHLHMGSDMAAPFGVAEIQLDDGPLVRGMLAELMEIEAIGRRVEARWSVVRTDDEGNEVVEPRFVLVAKRAPTNGAR